MSRDWPSQLGRYRLLKHLATGGMAEVYLATAIGIEGFQRHVVVKRIHREHAKHPQFVQMFLDEARLAASLHHHNIVQVHDIGQDDGEYFFAMEYVHGEDLRALLREVTRRKEKLPLEHVVTIVIGAAAGLHYAHEHRGPDRKPLGIVHRDISPSNIIVDYDGNVKVVDFGIAKAAQRTTETQSGQLKGKVAYMSPEQCRGKALDRRSDVYALGIVLYELTTARRLFKGESDFMTMSQIVAGKVPPPSSRRADLPSELEGIISKALAKDPASRYQSAQELRLALEQFAAAAGLRTSSTALASYMSALFGDKPEPWLVDDYVPPPDLGVDFDSAPGLAAVSMSNIEDFVNGQSSEAQSSPLMRARKKAITAGELAKAGDASIAHARPPTEGDPGRARSQAEVEDRQVPPMEGEGGHARSPTHMSGTPMAWTSPSVASVRSRPSWVMTLVATTLVAVGVAVITTRPWESSEPAPAASPATQPTAHEERAADPPAPDEQLDGSNVAPAGDVSDAIAGGATELDAADGSDGALAGDAADDGDGTAAADAARTAGKRTAKMPSKVRVKRKPLAKRPAKQAKQTKQAKQAKQATTEASTDTSWNPDTLLPE